MSLTSALHTSFAGIQDTSAKISVTSSNVTNADKTGYTRKTHEASYSTTTTAGTIPTSGTVTSSNLDPYLFADVISDTSDASKSIIQAEYLANYADRLGSTIGNNTLSASITELSTTLDSLSISPEDNSIKSSVINNADQVAFQLRELSSTVQASRLQADQEIAESIEAINIALNNLEQLNEQIQDFDNTGKSTADLEDDRRVELEKLSEQIDVSFFIDGQNQLKVYSGGRPLLDSHAHELSHTPASQIDGSVVYPGGLSGIIVDNADITTSISGGTLGGLIELRDTILVDEQAKLDEMANILADQMNTLLNGGASIPSRTTITGDVQTLALTDALTATGSMRIATTDQTGVVQNFNDFNMAGYATIGDMITDINTVLGPDVTASLTTDGELLLVSNQTDIGISMNNLTSSVGADNDSFASYFGLNNMFDATGAEDIQVSTYLKENSDTLATGSLSDSATLAIGDVGINVGDGSLSKSMNDAFGTATAFNAAGDFSAQSETLDNYADKIMASVAVKADNASENANTVISLLEQTQSLLQNLQGVNIDEEMTYLIDLESKYQASATMLSSIQDMFDELIAAVR